MIAEENLWCFTHWYLFTIPVAIIIVVYIVLALRVMILNHRLYKTDHILEELEESNCTNLSRRHKHSRHRLYAQMDRLETAIGYLTPIIESLRNNWIPASILLCMILFLCSALGSMSYG